MSNRPTSQTRQTQRPAQKPTPAPTPNTPAVRSPSTAAVSTMIPWNSEQMLVIRETVARGANLTEPEFKGFAYVCRELGADPLRKQIYAIRYQSGQPPTFQVALDFYRAKAHATGKLRGLLGPEWCGADGEWRDVWLDSAPPAAARFGIVHSEIGEVWAVALWSESNKGVALWKTIPTIMLAKTAETQCYRRAFPDQLGGIYTHEEMGVDPAKVLDGTWTVLSDNPEAPAEEERFGANRASLDDLIAGARDALQAVGGELKHVQKLYDWPGGGSIKEGLSAWARLRPEEDVVATLKKNLTAALSPQEEAPPPAGPTEEQAAEAQAAVFEGEVLAMEPDPAAQPPLMQ